MHICVAHIADEEIWRVLIFFPTTCAAAYCTLFCHSSYMAAAQGLQTPKLLSFHKCAAFTHLKRIQVLLRLPYRVILYAKYLYVIVVVVMRSYAHRTPPPPPLPHEE